MNDSRHGGVVVVVVVVSQWLDWLHDGHLTLLNHVVELSVDQLIS